MISRRALLLAPLAASACAKPPRDSYGGLERIRRERQVRVGLVENPPWVHVSPGRASGLEPALVHAWAASLGARPVYRPGDLQELVEALHKREITVLLAGLDRKTPYKSKVALTQAYLKIEEDGKKTQRAMAVSQGENAVLYSLDRFLAEQDEAALKSRLAPMGALA